MLYSVKLGEAIFEVRTEDDLKNGITKVRAIGPKGRFMDGWALNHALWYVQERGGLMVEVRQP